MPEAELLQSFFRDASDLVVILQANRTVSAANPAFLRAVAGADTGLDFMGLVAPGHRAATLKRLVHAAGGDTVTAEVLHGPDDHDTVLVEYRFFPMEGGLVAGIGRVRDADGGTREALGRARAELREKARILDDIQLELTQVPFIDPVTGVWNRMQVIERLTSEWSRGERYGSPISCLMIDIEGLDTLRAVDGALAADEILKRLARQLKRVVRDHDIVGRFNGDCFVVIAVHSDGAGARGLARRILDGSRVDPLQEDQHGFKVTLRIGGATNRSEGVEILEDLFAVSSGALDGARAASVPMKIASEVTV